MIVGAVVAAAVGALLAIPVLRLAGIYLSLATLAFALMFEYVLVPVGWIGGGVTPVRVPRPVIGPFDLSNDKSFFVFCLIVLAIVSVLVIFVRRGTTGHYLDALRGSETAAQSIGINPAKAKIVAFALSAGIAGLGGGLLAMQDRDREAQGRLQLLLRARVRRHRRVDRGADRRRRDQRRHRRSRSLPYILSEWLGSVRAVGVHPVRLRRDPVRPAPRGHAREREADLDRVLPAPVRQAANALGARPRVTAVRRRARRRPSTPPVAAVERHR